MKNLGLALGTGAVIVMFIGTLACGEFPLAWLFK